MCRIVPKPTEYETFSSHLKGISKDFKSYRISTSFDQPTIRAIPCILKYRHKESLPHMPEVLIGLLYSSGVNLGGIRPVLRPFPTTPVNPNPSVRRNLPAIPNHTQLRTPMLTKSWEPVGITMLTGLFSCVRRHLPGHFDLLAIRGDSPFLRLV